jgi:hypothetical protein
MKFEFELQRSCAKEHQAVGIRCRDYQAFGTIDANSVNDVRQHCYRLMIIPGVYEVRIRNKEPGNDWLTPVTYDTRDPDKVSAPKTSNRKPKTGAKRP